MYQVRCKILDDATGINTFFWEAWSSRGTGNETPLRSRCLAWGCKYRGLEFCVVLGLYVRTAEGVLKSFINVNALRFLRILQVVSVARVSRCDT